MSIQKIEYENKIGLQNDENVPNKNKVTDDDMNEIKETVNNNADELTTAQQNIENLQTGQGTASTDITSLKNRVTTLETDNTTNKQDINTLKTDNETNKSNIATLQTDVGEIEGNIQQIQQEQTAIKKEIQELDDNQIHIVTEKANNINIKDASGQNAKIKLFGISKQEGTPSPGSPIEIENTTGNVKIMDYNKNFLGIEDLNHTSTGLNWQITDNEVKITGTTTAGYSTSNEIECFIPAGSYKFLVVNGASNLTYRIWLYSSKNKLLKYPMSGEQFTLTENAVKYRLVFDNLTVGNTYNTTFNPMILLQTETDEEFEAHEEEVITFPLQNQKMFEGSYTADDGIHHKRKQFNLSSLTNVSDWTNKGLNENGTYTYFTRATNLMDYKFVSNLKALCTHFEFFGTVSGTSAMQNKGVGCAFYYTNHNDKLFYINTTIATTEELVACLSAQETAGTPVMLEYETEEETIEAYTEEQQETHNQLQNAKTYKLVTNIFTENAEVEMEYVAHTKTYIDNEINSVKEELNTIKELLSTTNTSALLLNNLQTDLESEVL